MNPKARNAIARAVDAFPAPNPGIFPAADGTPVGEGKSGVADMNLPGDWMRPLAPGRPRTKRPDG